MALLTLLAVFFLKHLIRLVCVSLLFNALSNWVLTAVTKRLCRRFASSAARKPPDSEDGSDSAHERTPLLFGLACELSSCTVTSVNLNMLTDFVSTGGKLAFLHLKVEGVQIGVKLHRLSRTDAFPVSPTSAVSWDSVGPFLAYALKAIVPAHPLFPLMRPFLRLAHLFAMALSLLGVTVHDIVVTSEFADPAAEPPLPDVQASLAAVALSVRPAHGSRALRMSLHLFSDPAVPVLRLGAGTAVVLQRKTVLQLDFPWPKGHHHGGGAAGGDAAAARGARDRGDSGGDGDDFAEHVLADDSERPVLLPSMLRIHLAPIKVVVDEADLDALAAAAVDAPVWASPLVQQQDSGGGGGATSAFMSTSSSVASRYHAGSVARVSVDYAADRPGSPAATPRTRGSTHASRGSSHNLDAHGGGGKPAATTVEIPEWDLVLVEVLRWVVCDFRLDALRVELCSLSAPPPPPPLPQLTAPPPRRERAKSVVVELADLQLLLRAEDAAFADALINLAASYASFAVVTQLGPPPPPDAADAAGAGTAALPPALSTPLYLPRFSGRVECLEKTGGGRASQRRWSLSHGPVLSRTALAAAGGGTPSQRSFELRLLGRLGGPRVACEAAGLEVLVWAARTVAHAARGGGDADLDSDGAGGEGGGLVGAGFDLPEAVDENGRARIYSVSVFHDVMSPEAAPPVTPRGGDGGGCDRADSMQSCRSLSDGSGSGGDALGEEEEPVTVRVTVSMMLALDVKGTELVYRDAAFEGGEAVLTVSLPDIKVQHAMCTAPVSIMLAAVEARLDVMGPGGGGGGGGGDGSIAAAAAAAATAADAPLAAGEAFSLVWLRLQRGECRMQPLCVSGRLPPAPPQLPYRDGGGGEASPQRPRDGALPPALVAVEADGLWVEGTPALACLAARMCGAIVAAAAKLAAQPLPLALAAGGGGAGAQEWAGAPLGALGAVRVDAIPLAPLGDPQRALACFANDLASLWALATAGRRGAAPPPLASVTVAGVAVEFPYALEHDSGDMGPADAVRWLRGYCHARERRARWSCAVVSVKEARIGAAAPPRRLHAGGGGGRGGGTPAPPEINFSAYHVDVSTSAYDASEAAGVAFRAQQVGFRDGAARLRSAAAARHHFLTVSRFGVIQAGDCVDIIVRGVRGSWRPRVQVHIIKCARDVTLAVWMVMLEARRAALCIGGGGGNARGAAPAAAAAAHNRNPPPTCAAALAYWSRAWQRGLLRPAGDRIHRLHAVDIEVSAAWASTVAADTVVGAAPGARAPLTAAVTVGAFTSSSVSEQFTFGGVALALCGAPLLRVEELALRASLRRDALRADGGARPAAAAPIGHTFHEVKSRVLAAAHTRAAAASGGGGAAAGPAFAPGLLEAAMEPAGWLIETRGVAVTIKYGLRVADIAEALMMETAALLADLRVAPGRWHPSATGKCARRHASPPPVARTRV
ncbi:hypothetical protein JKP88DRAFT_321715 [Tribonema minus]|uniref:Uncharacterized protein n=1 Tax=Tribonema minus TaxID=303371 RepID=A0A835YTG4_9STRA|nr:hypothetical protein JKP88DRAFT_321715 [Tribonema minus]